MTTLLERLQDNDQTAAWDFMPESMQEDVNGLVHEFAEKMDSEMWNKGFAAVEDAIEVLSDKKEFVLGNPMIMGIVGMSGIPAAKWSANYDPIVKLISTVSKTGISEHDDLKSFDGRGLLENLGSDFMPQVKALAAMAGGGNELKKFNSMVENVRFELVSSEGDKAVVLAKAADTASDELKAELDLSAAETEEFVRMEGKWIPAEMANEWPDMMKQARASIAELNVEEMTQNKEAFLAGLKTFDEVISGLADADSQEEFDKALSAAMQGAR